MPIEHYMDGRNSRGCEFMHCTSWPETAEMADGEREGDADYALHIYGTLIRVLIRYQDRV